MLRDRASPVAIAMSIRRYFKPTNQLPDPRGSLSAAVPPAVIASANRSASVGYGYPSFATRGATSSIDAHLHAPGHARATCKNIFVQFHLYEIILHEHFFSRKFTRRKKKQITGIPSLSYTSDVLQYTQY